MGSAVMFSLDTKRQKIALHEGMGEGDPRPPVTTPMNSPSSWLRLPALLICGLGVAVGIAPAAASPSANIEAKIESARIGRPTPRGRSRSVNYPWDGQLIHGQKVRESKFIRYVPEDAAAGRFYGTSEMVQLIERAARRVANRYPGSKLSIGELSSAQGGDIGGHRSHESGRDADVGFYVKGADGRPFAYQAFVPFNAGGRGATAHDLRFDDARNWELVSRLVSDPDARVQYIFVARAIKNRLMREAVRRKASAQTIERAESVLVEPARGNPHRSHFHLRIYCAPNDRPMCRDVAPFWAWYPGNAPLDPRSAHADATPTSRSPEKQPETLGQRATYN
jgi:penicillin-insensitive murein endopeptidase